MWVRIVAVVGAAALVVGGAAIAGGGASIATAPELPLRQQVLGAPAHQLDYYRVTLNPLDLLVVRFRATGREEVAVCTLPPQVDDYNLSSGNLCAHSRATVRPAELNTGRLNPGGRWTVVVGNADYDTCLPYEYAQGHYVSLHKDGCLAPATPYELTAHVKRYTRVSVQAPALVAAGKAFTIRGRVAGAAGGAVQIFVKEGRAQQRSAGVIQLGRDGSFAKKLKLRVTARLRLVYPGDADHQPSRTTLLVKAG